MVFSYVLFDFFNDVCFNLDVDKAGARKNTAFSAPATRLLPVVADPEIGAKASNIQVSL